ncbi:MAG TPA: nicotinate-nucleotide adenylyltransferase [Burkholderiaceae bacterium]|nr:nicotinate-nucleotide adenylyltransferase [Burkholderiaceae bacterium]
MRTGLFGGTFDPTHNAHVALARAALDALQLDELRWIPAGRPWQKARAITPAAHREAMVRLAIAGEPRFVLDRTELDREGPSYTLDTVNTLHAQQPQAKLFLVIGADQYAGLHTWRGWQELLGLVTLAVANRPGPLPAVHPDVRRTVHRVVPLSMLDISATDIRARVAQGLPIESMVPAAVASYISRHGLYRRN